MRFVVIGAGAIGSAVGGSLAHAGHDVVLVGRGAHFRAVAERGLAVRGLQTSFDVRIGTMDDATRADVPDAVLVATKAHHLGTISERIGAMARRGATIVTMQNGVPFWFFDGFGGSLAGTHLATVDPTGAISAAIDLSSIVQCVVAAGARIPRPGVVEQVGNAAYALGEPDRTMTERLRALVGAFSGAGLGAVADADVRRTVWDKLVTNAAVNPVSALTRASAEEMADDPDVAPLLRAIMREQIAVGRAIGIDLPDDADERVRRTRSYGDQRTSMLQDVEAGRRLELEPIVGAAVEVAGLAGVPVAATRHVYALAKLLDRGMEKGRRET